MDDGNSILPSAGGAPDDQETDDGVCSMALEQFHAICTAQQEERALNLQDRRFVTIAGAQWEGNWEQQFANSIMVEVNKAAQGVEKIIADSRANRVTVDFRVMDQSRPGEEAAETLNGLFLADVYASKGQQAFDGAFEEAVQGGMGAWRLCNRYVDEYDPDSDEQRIGFQWIPDADQSVFFDMDARLYDKSDAKFCFVITAMSPASYKKRYNDDPASWPQDILKAYYDWYTPTVVRVAEYYRFIERNKTRLWFEHSTTDEKLKLWAEDMKPGEAEDMKVRGWRQTGRKRVMRHLVEKLTMSAAGEIADRQIIAGDCIPIIPVYGKRSFIDNMERIRGHVRLSKDQARVYNAMVSKMVELSSISPTERPIFTSEQIAGHEDDWANANMNRHPFARINQTYTPDGQPIPAGPVGMVTPPQVPPVMAALMQIAANDINELTTNQDNADEVRSNVSAEAMDIAATRTDAKTFTYMDNYRQSMQRCGEVYESMASAIYVEEGRKVPTMDADGQQGQATLLEQKMDDNGGLYLSNDFANLKFNIISDVTEATSTRRDKTVRAMISGANATAPFDPQAASAMIGVAMMNMDGEGIDDLKDWWRKRLVQQGVVKPTEQEQQEMQQAQAEAQQKPDPQAALVQAATEKQQAEAGKAQAQTEQAKAQTVKYLAEAHATHADTTMAAMSADAAPIEAQQKAEAHRVSMFEKVTKAFQGLANKGAGQ